MSDKIAPVTDLNPEIDATETEPTRRQKAATFLKTHKKSTIAVVALVGLVGVSAVTGRKSATVTVQSPLEIEIDDEQSEDQSA